MKKVIDYPLFIITIMLTFFGIYMILSSTFYINIFDESKNPLITFFATIKQVGLGMLGMIVAIFFNAKFIKKISPLLMIISIVLLILTLTIGGYINGSSRWLKILGVSFATAEFAKLASILYFARILSKINKNELTYKRAWINLLLFGGLTAFLIFKQPDMSNTFIYCSIIGTMLFVSGAKLKHVGLLIALGILIFAIGISTMSYRMDRVLISRLDGIQLDGNAYQVTQSLMAIAEGGLLGVGPGKAYQTKNAQSQSESDFIFANVAETNGLMGSVLLISAYLFFIWRSVKIAINAETMYSCLVTTGVVSMVGYQAVLHLLVNVDAAPPTGVTLPFISAGGTSILVLLTSVGIVLKLSSSPRGLDN